MTKTNEKHITAIKLKDGGNKGLSVDYAMVEIRNNREFVTEYPGVKKKFPIHEELHTVFTWLRPYLLDICNYSADKDLLLPSTEITAVKYSDKGFVLSGTISTINDKIFAINTPLITEEDGYSDYSKVCAILDGIYTETKEYMDGKKMLSDTQYVINLNKGNTQFDQKTFESLPAEEQAKICSEYMAKNKIIAIHMEEFEEENEGVVQMPTSENWVGSADNIPKPEITEAEAEKFNTTTLAEVVTTPSPAIDPFDDNNFVVAIAEPVVAKSTAKRKA